MSLITVSQRHRRQFLALAMNLYLLAVADAASPNAQSGFAQLRSGTVQLSRVSSDTGASQPPPPSKAQSGTGGSTAVVSDGNEDGTRPGAIGGSSGGEAQRKLHLVQYESAANETIRADLLSRGCTIDGYIPQNTLIVYGPYSAVRDAVARSNALMAEYPATNKISPELEKVQAIVGPIRRRRRRQLVTAGLGAAEGGSASPAASAANGSDGKAIDDDDSTIDATKELLLLARLDGIQTWSDIDGSSTARQRRMASLSVVRRRRLNNLAYDSYGAFGVPLRNSDDDGGNNIEGSSTADGHVDATGVWKGESSGSASRSLLASAGTELYGINVHIVKGLTADVLGSEIFGGWAASLAASLGRTVPGDPCRPRAVDAGLNDNFAPRFKMFFCAEDVEDAVVRLSADPRVTWLDPALRATFWNTPGGWLVQIGDLDYARYTNITSLLEATRPYWKAGILGGNQIVGVGDTGLDMAHCSFVDDAYDPGALQAKMSGSPLRWSLPDHRKVVQYVISSSAQGDPTKYYGDEKDGHGTHVCGTIAGARTVGTNHIETGAAPAAKIAFTDVEAPGMSGLSIPSPIHTAHLGVHYSAGARLSSDSWGYSGSYGVQYESEAQGFDLFAWRNPDFLSMVAAGNSGMSGFIATVGSPGTAKNILSVGASMNHPKDYTGAGDQNMFLFRYYDRNNVLQQSALWPSGSNWYQWRMLLNTETVNVSLANPPGACSPISSQTGRVVVVDMGSSTCTNDMRAQNAKNSGAVGAIYVRNDGYFVDEPLSSSSTFYSYLLYLVVTKACS